MPVDIKKLKIVENSSLAVTQTGKKIGLKDFAKKDRTRPYFAFSGHSRLYRYRNVLAHAFIRKLIKYVSD